MTRNSRKEQPDGGDEAPAPPRGYRKVGGSVPIPPMASLSTEEIVQELHERFGTIVVLLHGPRHSDEDSPNLRQYIQGDEFTLLGMMSSIPQAVVHDIRRSLSEDGD